MKKIAELSNITPLNANEQKETKGGFFFFLFHKFSYGHGYSAPKGGHGYEAPKGGHHDGGKKGGKKGY